MNKNKLFIAAAGSGKTTHLVKEALKDKDKKTLITTYTVANEEEINKRIIKINGCIPENITVQTWFSFLLQHGVKPFQGKLTQKEIRGVYLSPGQSAQYASEVKDFEAHYFTKDFQLYSDKISKFVIRCNERNSGAVISRLARIYSNIYIDEIQDLAGYDLDFLKLLLSSSINVILVGDPRQGTYSTNNSSKRKKFKKGNIVHFFEDESIKIDKDDTTLTTNWRSNALICDLSNSLYPDFKKTISGSNQVSGHDGVFLIRKKDVDAYLKAFAPLQLRYSIATEVSPEYEVKNFGEAKGLEYDRVLIYPPGPAIKWLENNNSEFAPTSKSKFYVAITRARHSVGIVYDYKDSTKLGGIVNYDMNTEVQTNEGSTRE